MSTDSAESVDSYRRERVMDELARSDVAAIVLADPINIRYVTGVSNMQVWSMHTNVRFAVVFAGGPVVACEFAGAHHLAANAKNVDVVTGAVSWDYTGAGANADVRAGAWADELQALCHKHAGGELRVAIDQADLLAVRALDARGFVLSDGKGIMERARSVKSNDELAAMRSAYRQGAAALDVMAGLIRPGVSERELLGAFVGSAIATGGEYTETRLLASGTRTLPWFHEAGARVVEQGDVVAFDTDLVGEGGFFVDLSRSWFVGKVDPAVSDLYAQAQAQLEHNRALLKPGMTFAEVTQRAWKLPAAMVSFRYPDIVHGAGLSVEYPMIYYPQDAAAAYDGEIVANMVLCVESYVCDPGRGVGVKLEDAFAITADGAEPLVDVPFSPQR